MSECCVKNCKKTAKFTYTIDKVVVFQYCKKHTIIPEKMMQGYKVGFYTQLSNRDIE